MTEDLGSGHQYALAYVYCNKLVPDDINSKRLLGSVLKQLLEQLPLSKGLPKLENLMNRSNEPPIIQEIKTAIKDICNTYYRTYIVFDGLDECYQGGYDESEKFGDFCNFIRSLPNSTQRGASTKVIVFSRPEYPQIDKAFTGCPDVRVDSGANDTDIEEYIATKTINLLTNETALGDIKTSLLSRADGMFLWVDLIIKALRYERSPRKMKDAVHKLPQSLNDVYQLSLERVLSQPAPVKERALKTILWVVNARRSLSRNEIREILSIEPRMEEWDDSWLYEHDMGLTAECGDLVMLVDGHYQLIHLSLKEYLTNIPPSTQSLLEYRNMQIDQAHTIAEICLTYVNLDLTKQGPASTEEELSELQKKHPFLEYSSVFWGFHFEDIKDTKWTDLKYMAQSFLHNDKARELSMQQRFQLMDLKPVFPYPGKSTPLHLLSMFNLVELASLESNIISQISQHDGFQNLPLDNALRNSHHEITNWLLSKHIEEHKRDPAYVIEQRTLGRMNRAATLNWPDAIKLLSRLDTNIEQRVDDKRLTPLHCAVKSDSFEALKTLLELGANINAQNADGENALILALKDSRNSEEVAQILIDAGADLTLANNKHETALHHAAAYGFVQITKALLDKGADINELSDSGSSPLYCAIEEGNTDTVELLIKRGADVEAKGSSGWNPLFNAAFGGLKECVTLLIEADADVNVTLQDGRSVTHIAVENGHLDIFSLLTGAYPDIAI
jgi:Ankyrin repeats (3 copies)/Ankyrin repeats (many copies)